VKALLALSILLLSGCTVTESPNATDAATSTTSGSSNPGGSSGGSSSSSSSQPAGTTVNPTGIWDINDTVNGKPVTAVALIAGGNYYSFATTDQFGCGDITGGTYAIDGSMFTGSGATKLLNDCTTSNGQYLLTYTLNGYMTGPELNLSFDVGGTLVPTLGATLDPLYNLYTSSLATLVGNWDDAGNVLTVNPDGTFFEQQGNGCTITGAYTIIDPAYNLYGVSFLFDPATCSTNSIAGIQFTGLAYLTPNTSSGWYHLLEDASGVNASGALVVVADSITPYFAPPTG
jgi:hypothetical protein